MSLILALMLQASVAALSTANCTGARQGEVCTEEGRAALRAALDVKPLQAETADGVEVYRAFYLEGGGGLPAVAFVRRPGHSPSVEVSSGANRKMTADVPQEVWRQIQQAGDELLIPVEVRTPAPIDVCMDGGAIFAEIGLPSPDNRSRARIKQLSSSSCESNAIVSFARLAAKLAEPLFPACAAISGDAAPDGVFRLSNCFRFSGDEMAAAEVFSRARQDLRILKDDSITRKRLEWRRVTGVDPWTRLQWAGRDIPRNRVGHDEGGATDFLIAREGECPGLSFEPGKLHGVSSTVVEVDGFASCRPADRQGQSVYATYRQVWRRAPHSDWRVMEWVVGPFAPVT